VKKDTRDNHLPFILFLNSTTRTLIFSDGHNDEGNYPDIIAFLIVFLMTALVAAGVRNSVIFNNALNIVNALVWVFIVVAGLVYANWWNWTGDRFLPMGWPGVSKDLL